MVFSGIATGDFLMGAYYRGTYWGDAAGGQGTAYVNAGNALAN